MLALSCCCCLDKSPRIRGLQGTCICCANLFDNNTILPISMIRGCPHITSAAGGGGGGQANADDC